MFILSKVFWFLVDPANLAIVFLAFGSLLLFTGPKRAGRRIVALTVMLLIAVSVFPVGSAIIEVLENRFPGNPVLPERVDGIVVLGGTVDQELTAARKQPALKGGAERLTEFVHLARKYPEAKLVFTGGSGSIFDQTLKETTVARQFFEQMGLEPGRITYESDSRNTQENATLTHEIMKPADGETWVLVTSARHMPRAVGCFRQAGWTVVPYPVDYLTYGTGEFELTFNPLSGLSELNNGLHEWLGLIAYRLMGRTPALLPGPEP